MEYGVYRTPRTAPTSTGTTWRCTARCGRRSTAPGPAGARGLVGCDTYSERFLFLPEQTAGGIDIDPFVDLYSVHFYNLRFDPLPPSEGSWTRPIGDLMAETTRQVATAASAGSGSSRPRWAPSISAGG